MKSIRQRLALLSVVILLGTVSFGVPALLLGKTIQSGVPFFSNQWFSLTWLSSTPVSGDDARALQGLAPDVDREIRQGHQFGIVITRPVRILVVNDAKFPVRDLWSALDFTPDASFFKNLETALMKQNEEGSIEGLTRYQEELRRTYSLFNDLPLAICIAGLKGEIEATEVSDFITRLKASLDRPFGECSSIYGEVNSARYSKIQSAVWVPTTKSKEFHRYRGVINHEVGHHLFAILFEDVVKKNGLMKTFSMGCLEVLRSYHFLPLDEFFADSVAVMNGNQLVLSTQGIKNASDELKRYFSQERTLAEFLEASRDEKKGGLLGEGHQILNPVRSVLWKLKLKLGTEVAYRLLVETTREWVKSFFLKDVLAYEHKEVAVVPGAFSLKDYPKDVVSVNQNALKLLQGASDKLLTSEQKKTLAEISKNVFGNLLPK
ncbi:MAG: hypothetical protein WA705_31590 [Candidatus Ozemobacteraceae bacterium]